MRLVALSGRFAVCRFAADVTVPPAWAFGAVTPPTTTSTTDEEILLQQRGLGFSGETEGRLQPHVLPVPLKEEFWSLTRTRD